MQISGINHFNIASLGDIPKANVIVPKIEKKEPTVHQSSVPYPFHRPTFEETMKNHARMQAMFQEMFKDVKPLEVGTYETYTINGVKSEIQFVKGFVNREKDYFSDIDIKI